MMLIPQEGRRKSRVISASIAIRRHKSQQFPPTKRCPKMEYPQKGPVKLVLSQHS